MKIIELKIFCKILTENLIKYFYLIFFKCNYYNKELNK